MNIKIQQSKLVFAAKAACLGVAAMLGLSASAQNAAQAPNDGGLKFINIPNGGHVVYGPMTNVTTLPAAMASVLKVVHGHFGDKPQIGRFFQSNSGDSVATFFTLTAKNQDGKPVSGLVIVAMPAGLQPAAAVLFDDSNRFAKTEGVLMAKLNEAWKKEGPAPAREDSRYRGPGPVGHEGERPAPIPAHMQTAALADNSATVSLPAGWRITGGGSGGMHVAGPNGEQIHMAVMVQGIYDPQNPRSQQMVRYLQMSHKPVIMCPRSVDLVAAYMCVSKQNRAMQNLPPMSFNVAQRTPMQGGGVVATGEMDLHDGKGPYSAKVQLDAMPEGPQGGWALTIFAELIPQQLASAEWPTINAIAGTYRQNGQVIYGQARDVINEIHRNSDANTMLAKARSDANDVRNQGVEKYWDDNAKYNKSFENYTLDRTVVGTVDNEAHGTFTNPTADWLVQSHPDQFKYVQTRDLLKGLDY